MNKYESIIIVNPSVDEEGVTFGHLSGQHVDKRVVFMVPIGIMQDSRSHHGECQFSAGTFLVEPIHELIL